MLTVVFLISLPSFAWADHCAGPTVADVLAEVQATGPCTIGDKTFNFTSYSKNGVSNGAYDAELAGARPTNVRRVVACDISGHQINRRI